MQTRRHDDEFGPFWDDDGFLRIDFHFIVRLVLAESGVDRENSVLCTQLRYISDLIRVLVQGIEWKFARETEYILVVVDEPEAALCAPNLAITREREIRGLRAMSAFGFGGTGIRDAVVVCGWMLLSMSLVATVVKDGTRSPGGIAFGLPNPANGWVKIVVGRGD